MNIPIVTGIEFNCNFPLFSSKFFTKNNQSHYHQHTGNGVVD